MTSIIKVNEIQDAGGNTILSSNGTGTFTSNLPSVNNRPAFYANQSSSQSISSGTHTKLVFDTEILDTNNCYDTTNYRFTPNVAGYYSFNLSLRCDNTATEWWLYILRNGSDYFTMVDVSVINWGFSMNALLYANGTSDYFEPYFYQATGSTRTTSNSNTVTRFSAYKIIT